MVKNEQDFTFLLERLNTFHESSMNSNGVTFRSGRFWVHYSPAELSNIYLRCNDDGRRSLLASNAVEFLRIPDQSVNFGFYCFVCSMIPYPPEEVEPRIWYLQRRAIYEDQDAKTEQKALQEMALTAENNWCVATLTEFAAYVASHAAYRTPLPGNDSWKFTAEFKQTFERYVAEHYVSYIERLVWVEKVDLKNHLREALAKLRDLYFTDPDLFAINPWIPFKPLSFDDVPEPAPKKEKRDASPVRPSKKERVPDR